jgi:predicted nucleic acid-binding protein
MAGRPRRHENRQVILVDSSVWIEYFNGKDCPQTDKLDSLLGTELLATGDLMLTEILQGFRTDTGFEEARRLLTSLDVIELGGRDIAVQAARNYRQLRGMGITVRKTIDTIIATRCIEDEHQLLFTDRDFEPFVQHLGLKSVLRT